MNHLFRTLAEVSLIALLSLTAVLAAPGDLDTTFAGTGKSRIGFGGGLDIGNAVVVQSDGKLVMAGSARTTNDTFALARFDPQGTLDPTFGDEGKVITPVNSTPYQFPQAAINALAIQPDGKIVAAGHAYYGTNYSSFTLTRYHLSGALDTNFGTNGNGIVYTGFGTGSVIRAISIQADGKIVAAGYTVYPGGNAGELAVALARYDTNGMLDSSFGNGGTQVTTGVNGYTGAHAVTIQPDGKILAVGIGIGPGHNGIDFALYRYTTNGFLDPAFGGGTGKAYTAMSANPSLWFDSANAVAIQFGNFTPQNPDKIVVAGSHRPPSSDRTTFAVTRYFMDGTLDTSFGNNGIVTNSLAGPGEYNYGHSVIVQGFGIQPRRITVGGYGFIGTNTFFVMARYNANGTLDTTFGTNGTGKVTLSFGAGRNDEARAMTLQSGNFILAGSSAVDNDNKDFAAVGFTSTGLVDTNFGSGGIATADIADRDSYAKAVAIQLDGRMVVAGRARDGRDDVFALARYNVDGALDATFGSAGRVKTKIGSRDYANAVAIQSDGRIVAAGLSQSGVSNLFAVVRYNIDGSLDTSFSGDGKATTHITGADEANAVIFQGDGRIVVAGYSDNGPNDDFAVVRYHPDGTPDSAFNGTGKILTAIASGDDHAQAVKIQADGKIVVAGYGQVALTLDFALVRYNTNGTLDNSFGSFGRAVTDFAGSSDYGFGMAIQPNGKIIVVGAAVTPGSTIHFALARYNTNGAPDSSFGTGGKVTTQIGLVSDYATAVALQPDGKIVAAGVSAIGGRGHYALVRYNPDGSLDTSYGIGGKTVMEFGAGGNDSGYAVALDSIGRAVLAGDANNRFGVARFLGDPMLRILSIGHGSGGRVFIEGIGVPGSRHTLQSSPNVFPGSFGGLAPVVPDAAGLWRYEDISSGSHRFYRLSYP